MTIGEKGYLIEVGTRGTNRGDTWLKPPLFELIDIQKGFNVTHYVFKSVNGGYRRTLVNADFDLGEWAFYDSPDWISRSEQPRLRARTADISKHSYITKFNKGGFPS